MFAKLLRPPDLRSRQSKMYIKSDKNVLAAAGPEGKADRCHGHTD
jgi:hypothetical protein